MNSSSLYQMWSKLEIEIRKSDQKLLKYQFESIVNIPKESTAST